MSQKDVQRLFLQNINFGYRMGFTGVGWDKPSDTVIYKRSTLRLVWEILQMGILVAYELFLCYQLLVTASTANVRNSQKIQIRYAALSWILLTYNPTICIYFGKECVRLINGFRSHVKSASVAGNSRTRITIRFLQFMRFVCIFATTTNGLGVFLSPHSLRWFSSMAADPKRLPLLVKCAISGSHLMMSSFLFYSLCVHASIVFWYSQEVLSCTSVLYPSNFRGNINRNSVSFSMKYRALQVLQANFDAIYRPYNIVQQIMTISVAVLAMYQAVKFRSLRALILAVASGVGRCWYLKHSAMVYETSRDVLIRWKQQTNSRGTPLCRRFLKSCRVVSIPVGNFFYVDRRLILTTISIILNTCASLILTN